MRMVLVVPMMRCPSNGRVMMRYAGSGHSGRHPIKLGGRMKGSSSNSVRSQIERLYPRLVGQDEPQHPGKVGSTRQVQRCMERIVADAEIGTVLLENIEAVIGKVCMLMNCAHADGHVDGVAAIALFVMGRSSLQ